MASDTSEYMNIAAAAEFLGYKSTRTLSNKAQDRVITAYKVGQKWMFKRDDLVEFMERHRIPARVPSRRVTSQSQRGRRVA